MLEALASFITHLIESTSYLGVIALMTIESCNIPIPSEVVLPFSGFLVAQGKMNFLIAALSGAIGCTIGSLLSYYLGRFSEHSWVRGFINGPGRLVLTQYELKKAEGWLRRYGDIVAFISRLLPIVRTFVSFPAGMAGVNLARFTVYTFVGSFIWSIFLVYIGLQLGEHWESISGYFRQFDLLILLLVIIGLAWVVKRHTKNFRSDGSSA